MATPTPGTRDWSPQKGLSRRSVLVGAAGGLALAALPRRAFAVTRSPQTTTNDSAQIEQQVNSAYNAGHKSVRIEPGTYYIAPINGQPASLYFSDLTDFRIDADGVTFVLLDNTANGIRFQSCQNVTLTGATITPRIVPTTQGTVTAVNGSTFDFTTDPGYPALDDATAFKANPTSYIFDPTTLRFKEGSPDLYSTGVTRLGTNSFRLQIYYTVSGVSPGDLVAFRGLGAFVVHSIDCSGMSFENLRILNSNGYGLFEYGGQANQYTGIHIGRGAAPAGASRVPLLGSTADALHSAAMRVGPLVENCLFEYMADDGIAVHGYYYMINSVTGPSSATAVHGPSFMHFQAGDKVQLIDSTGVPKAEAVIENVQSVSSVPSSCPLPSPYSGYKYSVQIEFDRSLPLSCGDYLSDASAVGSGCVIRNNTVRYHRARGVYLKVHNGLAECNTLDHSSIAGIAVGTEPNGGEASYAENVTVRNNTVVHSGYVLSKPSEWGAITVFNTFTGQNAVGNNGLTIEDNIIRDVNGVNMYLDGISNSLVQNNQFDSPDQQPGIPGGSAADNNVVVRVDRADGLHFTGNTVTQPGPANTGGLVLLGDNAHNVTGLPGGITEYSGRRPHGGGRGAATKR